MHIPVLLNEVLMVLDPKPNENYIDCTLGEGGHSLEILKKILPNGKLLGIDLDKRNIEFVKNKFKENDISKKNFVLVNDNFKNLKAIVEKNDFKNINGILLDLGLNTYFLETAKRGFSFQIDEELDMRFDKAMEITAKEIVNTFSSAILSKILTEYGEEQFAENIVKAIILQRKTKPINTTFELNEIIFKATPNWYHHRKIHPSTKTFQALRIYVNSELINLKNVLEEAVKIVGPKAKIAVISFHSLEDRIVKEFFKEMASTKEFTIFNKHVIAPKWAEVDKNKKSRSAKLRILIKN